MPRPRGRPHLIRCPVGLCQRIDTDVGLALRHLGEAHVGRCPVCGQDDFSLQHLRQCNDRLPRERCHDCAQLFPPAHAKRHYEQEHEGPDTKTCKLCPTRGSGEAIYLHERRAHGLSAGNRIVLAVMSNLPRQARPREDPEVNFGPRNEEEGDPNWSIGPGNREVADMSIDEEGNGDRIGERDVREDAGSGREEAEGADNSDDGVGPPDAEDEADPRLHAELLDELFGELLEFLFQLEVVHCVPESVVDEVTAKLHVFATFGANLLPNTNLFREVLLREGHLTTWRRRKIFEGKFGESSAQLRFVPGERHQRPQIYYKGVTEHLRTLTLIPEVVAGLTGEGQEGPRPWYESHEEIVHSFRSAERFSAIKEFLGQQFIGVRMYGDGFGLNNIGAHRLDKNEYYGIYCQITTMPAHLSRKVSSWLTIAVADLHDVQEISQVWATVTAELKSLFERGFYVPGADRVFPVVLCGYAGDLKDKNALCAITGPGTSRYPHVTSLVDSRARRAASSFDDVNPLAKQRTRAGLEQDIAVYQRTGDLVASRGVKGRSVLDECSDFLAEGFLTPDTAHSWYLGVFQADICLCLSVFNARGHVAQEEIRGRLTEFKETVLSGPEKANFVTNVLGQKVTGEKIRLNLKGSISQLRLICKYCTVIFSDLRQKCSAPVDETAWEIMKALNDMSRYLESFALSKRQILEFQTALEDYTNLRIRFRDEVERAFKERFDLLPKHVDMLSAASAYRSSGCLLLTSTATMESRNGLVKSVVQKSHNRKNCVKTIGKKLEMLEKWSLTKLFNQPETLPSKWGTKNLKQSVTTAQYNELMVLSREVDICQKVTHRGKELYAGNVVEVYQSPECLSTENVKILAFGVNREDKVRIFAEDFELCYLQEYNVYGIRRYRGNVRVVQLEELTSPCANIVLRKKIQNFDHVFTKSVMAPLL